MMSPKLVIDLVSKMKQPQPSKLEKFNLGFEYNKTVQDERKRLKH